MTDEQKAAARTIAALMKQHFPDITGWMADQLEQFIDADDAEDVDPATVGRACYLSECLTLSDVDGRVWAVRFADGFGVMPEMHGIDGRTDDPAKAYRWSSKAKAVYWAERTGGQLVQVG